MKIAGHKPGSGCDTDNSINNTLKGNNMNALTLEHIDGDCGNFTTGNTFDLLAVMNGDKQVATVKLSYEDDSKEFALTCSDIDHASARFIANDVYLIACVTATLMRAFTEDHEFYCDVFYDEEGNKREIPLYDPIAA